MVLRTDKLIALVILVDIDKWQNALKKHEYNPTNDVCDPLADNNCWEGKFKFVTPFKFNAFGIL